MRRLHPIGRDLAPASLALVLWLISAATIASAMGGAEAEPAEEPVVVAGELEGEQVGEPAGRAEAVVAAEVAPREAEVAPREAAVAAEMGRRGDGGGGGEGGGSARIVIPQQSICAKGLVFDQRSNRCIRG